LLRASRAQPHSVGFAPLPAGRHRKRQISQIGTAIKPGSPRLATMSNPIAGKLKRFAHTNFESSKTHEDIPHADLDVHREGTELGIRADINLSIEL
jgi:hypothetical protein